MALYYFHIRAGDRLEEDLQGAEFETLELAIEDALIAAREIMADKVLAGYQPNGQIFEIANSDGQLCATVPFLSAINRRT